MTIRGVFEDRIREATELKVSSRNDSEYKSVFSKTKNLIHAKLLEELDLNALEKMSSEELKKQLKDGVKSLVQRENLVVTETDLNRLVFEIQNEVIGLGPLEVLLADATISDILINNASNIYIERHGLLEKSRITFDSNEHLLRIIQKIVSRIGRRIDESSPMVDARLPDGSRVNAIIPPLALDGPSMSIRRFSATPLSMGDLVKYGALNQKMASFLAALVKAKTNILIAGGTGSGKTTLLNVLSSFIPDNERIITIEDAAELRMQQPHVVRLETRQANVEGLGEVSQRSLVQNCLRMRPDRIVIGEVRGIEVLDMLQAMNTGHEGSLTTIHANSAREAISRLEHMVGMAGVSVVQKSLRQQIVSAISVVVHASRLSDGRRRITSICEIVGMDGDSILMQDIFSFEQKGITRDGAVDGTHVATEVRPKILSKLESHGASLDDLAFKQDSP